MIRLLPPTLSLLVLATAAEAQTLKVSPALAERLSDGETVDVLAVFDEYPDLSGAYALGDKAAKGDYVFAALTQYRQGYRPLLDTLAARGIGYRELWSAGALYLPDATASLLDVLEDAGAGLTLAPSDAAPLREVDRPAEVGGRAVQGVTWGLDFIGAREVWASGVAGEGVVIGGQDTGYDWDHPALITTYRGYVPAGDSARHDYNWYDAVKRRSPLNQDSDNPCGYNTTAACDDGSHGTHTMGTMTGHAGGDTIGVAPAAEWIGCRNMDRGDGTPQQYLECFQWFLAPTDTDGDAPRPELAPDVIANSWYCPLSEGCDSATYPAFERAVAALRAAGVVVVVSAGNDGPACNTTNEIPRIVEGVIAVAAHDSEGRIANFSSRGGDDPSTWPTLAAPGVAVRSAVPPQGYADFNGTSMAGPHVAGVVALMISANPALRGQVDTIAALLLRSARPQAAPSSSSCGVALASDANPNPVYGHGYLDAAAAVALARGGAGASPVAAEGTASAFVDAAPNPVGALLTLRTGAGAAGASLTVFDAAGRLVAQRLLSGERSELVTADWAPGVYLWRVAGPAGVASGRVVKD